MKKIFLALTVSLFLLGCAAPQDTTQIVKALPQVQAFLNEHPNAEIKAVYLPKGAGNYSDIKQKCGVDLLTEKDLWYASVKEGTVYIEVWLDGSSQKFLCAYKSPTATPAPISTTTPTPTPQPKTDWGFTVQTPSGWERDDSGKLGTLAIWWGPLEDGFRTNINLVREDVGDITLNEYEQGGLENARKLLTDYKALRGFDVLIDGMRGKTHTASFRQGQSTLTSKYVFFILNRKAYTFTYTALERNFQKYEHVFDTFMNSLKLEKSEVLQEPENACKAACLKAKEAGQNLTQGPCLSNQIAQDWVCDVAHSPRQTVDDDSTNQCPAFGKTANHFVEVDENCNVIVGV